MIDQVLLWPTKSAYDGIITVFIHTFISHRDQRRANHAANYTITISVFGFVKRARVAGIIAAHDAQRLVKRKSNDPKKAAGKKE